MQELRAKGKLTTSTAPKVKPIEQQIDEALRELDKSVLTLITFNHRDAWSYDWDTFKLACEVIQEIRSDLFKTGSIAIANGISLPFSDQKQQEKFLKGK